MSKYELELTSIWKANSTWLWYKSKSSSTGCLKWRTVIVAERYYIQEWLFYLPK